MTVCIDKPCIFENDDIETIEIQNSLFDVDEKGNLLIKNNSTKELIGYFPATKWDCAYRKDE